MLKQWKYYFSLTKISGKNQKTTWVIGYLYGIEICLCIWKNWDVISIFVYATDYLPKDWPVKHKYWPGFSLSTDPRGHFSVENSISSFCYLIFCSTLTCIVKGSHIHIVSIRRMMSKLPIYHLSVCVLIWRERLVKGFQAQICLIL